MALKASTIGIGTYLGREDDRTDTLYFDAIVEAVRLGCNVIDTALNYRGMKSERVVGRVVQNLTKGDPEVRKKLIIATKGGFIPVDVESGQGPAEFFRNRFLKTGILDRTDIVGGCHSLRPEYIRECVLMSLENLGLEYIDIYYIHNPELGSLKTIKRVPTNATGCHCERSEAISYFLLQTTYEIASSLSLLAMTALSCIFQRSRVAIARGAHRRILRQAFRGI